MQLQQLIAKIAFYFTCTFYRHSAKMRACIWVCRGRKTPGFDSDTVLLWVCSVPATWKAWCMNSAPHCEWDNATNQKSNYSFHILSYFLQPKKLLYFRFVSVHHTTNQTCTYIFYSVLFPLLVKKDQGTDPVSAVECLWCLALSPAPPPPKHCSAQDEDKQRDILFCILMMSAGVWIWQHCL